MTQDVQHLEIYPKHGITVAKLKGFKKLIYQIIPRHTLLPVWTELQMAWLRFQTRNVPNNYKNAENLLVNLGAGSYGKPGWINVDVYKAPGVNCLYDCRKKLPFPDNSIKGIFCEHFFEHIDYTEEVPYFLSECYRTLKKGGVIRIIVPDIEKYIHAYLQEGWNEITKVRQLDSEQKDIWGYGCKYNTKLELINVVFRQGYEHKYAYDYQTLQYLLYKYGFSKVQLQEFGKTLMDELFIDQPSRASESLYIEAVK